MFVVLLFALGVFIAYLFVTGKRPRVGSMVAVVILATVVLGAAYTPQTALWVLFAVVLARPFKPEIIAVSITGLFYYVAIWGWLGGWLTTTQNGPYMLYWLAIILHVLVELWLLTETVADIVRPARDAVRSPAISDPIWEGSDDGVAVAPAPSRALPEDDPSLAGYERPTPAAP